ncbi:MAG TPA: hypothetical protein VGF95_11765 [Solirubrobacteraceae bacterium]|jgi:hypothetical protein
MAINVARSRLTGAAARSNAQDGTKGTLADIASYWLINAGIYLTFGLLFYYAAKEKLIDDSGTMPAGLAKAYQGTFVASFPGTNTSWLLVGLLEALVFVMIAGSVLTGEFLPTRRKPILLSGLGLAMLTFAIIAWGENITGEFTTVAELFQYLTGTAVLIVLVLLMPPYRRTQWLSGLRGGAHDGSSTLPDGHQSN